MLKNSIKSVVALSLLISSPAFAGKWLDYGNGMINLDNYRKITPFAGKLNPLANDSSKKNTSGNVCVDGKLVDALAYLENAKNMPNSQQPFGAKIQFVGDKGPFTLTLLGATCDKDDAEDALQDAMKIIRKFLDSSDGYRELD